MRAIVRQLWPEGYQAEASVRGRGTVQNTWSRAASFDCDR